MAVICGDSLEWLAQQEGLLRAGFADIPDNIGLKYEGFDDNKPIGEYMRWVGKLLGMALKKFEIFWLSYNQIHDLWIKSLIKAMIPQAMNYKQIIWRYTFGQYNDSGFTSGYRPIALFHRTGLNYDAIRTVSVRTQMGDKRAKGLRIPDDVWEYPRVVGNAAERRSWHPTQHPEDLIQRIVLLSCTRGSGPVEIISPFVDLFAGSGTSAVVCKRLGVDCTSIELSPVYAKKIEDTLRAFLANFV